MVGRRKALLIFCLNSSELFLRCFLLEAVVDLVDFAQVVLQQAGWRIVSLDNTLFGLFRLGGASEAVLRC